MANRLILALLLLGTCGAIAGLVAGYGVARGINRSIFQLSVPIRDVAGKLNEVVGPIAVSADPSVEELETMLGNVSAQVASVVEQLHERHREVIRADQLAAVGQLAAGLAHELRNPLMCMKVLVQSAACRGDNATLDSRDLQVLNEEITRLETLLQTFMDFARPAKLEKQEADLASIVRQTVDLLSGKAKRRNVTIDCRLSEEQLTVEADAAQLRQVVLNLLLNALDTVPAEARYGWRPSMTMEDASASILMAGANRTCAYVSRITDAVYRKKNAIGSSNRFSAPRIPVLDWGWPFASGSSTPTAENSPRKIAKAGAPFLRSSCPPSDVPCGT